jgi:hypothetical protein
MILTQERFDLFRENILSTKNPFKRAGILKYVSTVNKGQVTLLSKL